MTDQMRDRPLDLADLPTVRDDLSSDFRLPGSGRVLRLRYHSDSGELDRISGEGTTYIERLGAGRRRFGELAELHEQQLGHAVTRTVQTGEDRWDEDYRLGTNLLLDLVDGVVVDRDDYGRIVRCHSSDDPDHDWHYDYVNGALVRIDNGRSIRHITWDAGRQRVVASRVDGERATFDYGPSGHRLDVGSIPATHHRDGLGRLWEVIDLDGRIVATYLWDRYMCLGRIDGALGDPLAAAFLLDPTGTPVRVVDGSGSRRIPRDAFGQGLLAESEVPGVFGGIVLGDHVHLPCRVLDPVNGSFCSPDPFDGGPDDPRRQDGYDGALPTETDRGGPYAVCRNDPIGRSDPTGAFTGAGGKVALIISGLTWSLQNNLVTFFGIDWLFNFVMSLVTGFQLGDFGSSDTLGSDRLGAFGVRRDGFVAWMTTEQADTGRGRVGRAFTTQHIVWSPAKDFDELAEARVIDPRGRFEPSLYGTVLAGTPDDGPDFVLQGTLAPSDVAAVDLPKAWSRSGGPAEPATPGAVIPKFPSGGFHLDDTSSNPHAPGTLLGIRGPQNCRLAEVAGREPAVATVDRSLFVVTALGTTIASGAMALLTDGAGDLALVQVLNAVGPSLIIEDDLSAIDAVGATVVGVDPLALSGETRDGVAAREDAFSAIGATAPYALADLVRMQSNDGESTTARVSAFETRLPLDRPLPTTFGDAIQVRLTAPGTSVEIEILSANQFRFTGPALPLGRQGVVRGSGGDLAVTTTGTGATRTADADLTTVAAVDETATYTVLASGTTLGNRVGGPEVAAELTYSPGSVGTAPDGAVGEVFVQLSDGSSTVVRRVAGSPIHDAVVVDRIIGGTAPFTVERWRVTPGAGVVPVIAVTATARITVDPSDAINTAADAASDVATVVLKLQLLQGDPPVAARTPFSAVAVAGATLSTSQTVLAPQSEPQPGQVIILDPGGADELVSVREVRVTAEFDRPLATGDDPLTAVPLQIDPNGTQWQATRLDTDRVLLAPLATTAAGPVSVEFPRIAVGETVQVQWQSGGNTEISEYRVGAVDGLTLDLQTGQPIPTAATDLLIDRLIPADPMTGSELVAREGRAIDGVDDQVDFAVWQPDALAPDSLFGIAVDADTTIPARVEATTQPVTIELTRTPTVSGPVDVGIPTVMTTRYSARFLADGDGWLLEDVNAAGLSSDQPSRLVVTPMAEVGDAVTGEIGGGTLLVPEDEGHELDRKQSLVDHELRHTQQYSWFGPLWFNWFPLWAVELGLDIADDNLDMPSYGQFVPAVIAPYTSEEAGNVWHCTFESEAAANEFSNGDQVQIVRGGQFIETKIKNGPEASQEPTVRFLKDESSENSPMPTGQVMARKMTAHPAADIPLSILRATTHGGLLNWGFGNTWGRLLWLASKGVYGIVRSIQGPGHLHPVTVEGDNRDRVRLTTEEGIVAMRGASMVIVRDGDDSVVRGAQRQDEDLLVLDDQLPFDVDDLLVAPFDAHDPGSYFDWLDYQPAEIIDPADATVIVVDRGEEEDNPAFRDDDRVEILFRDTAMRADVLSVTEDSPVEGRDALALSQPVPVGADGETSLRIAKLGSRDPMNSVDSTVLTNAGLNWLRFVLDPYGQISRLGHQEDGSFWDIISRVARYGLGTRSWSLLPALGYVFWFRLFREANAHATFIEQEASEQSGDLYSPVGRLLGQVSDADGFAHKRMTVGDIARYWYWPVDRYANLVRTQNLAAPGTNLDADEIRLLANRTPTDRNAPADSSAGTNGGARVVPDLFGRKTTGAPGTFPATNPIGIIPSQRGLIPLTPSMQRCIGCYVAWTRPGDHRAVTRDNIRDGDAQDLHDDETRQTLFYDVTVDDVVVTAAGTAVAEGDSITMVLLQAIDVIVTPGGNRIYAATVGRPEGPVLGATGTRLTAGAVTTAAGVSEPVEISRFYQDRGGRFGGGLDRFGLHLGGDVHVPVRQFTVEVVDTVPMRQSVDPASAATPLSLGGGGVVLVPSPIVTPLRLTSFDGREPRVTDPEVVVTQFAAPLPPETAAFLGPGGAAFVVSVGDAPAIGSSVPVEFEVTVGDPDDVQAVLTCRTTIDP